MITYEPVECLALGKAFGLKHKQTNYLYDVYVALYKNLKIDTAPPDPRVMSSFDENTLFTGNRFLRYTGQGKNRRVTELKKFVVDYFVLLGQKDMRWDNPPLMPMACARLAAFHTSSNNHNGLGDSASIEYFKRGVIPLPKMIWHYNHDHSKRVMFSNADDGVNPFGVLQYYDCTDGVMPQKGVMVFDDVIVQMLNVSGVWGGVVLKHNPKMGGLR